MVSIFCTVPNKGTASEVAGIVSATIFRKTVNDKSIVIPKHNKIHVNVYESLENRSRLRLKHSFEYLTVIGKTLIFRISYAIIIECWNLLIKEKLLVIITYAMFSLDSPDFNARNAGSGITVTLK